MTPLMRILGAVALCGYLTGCSTYQAVPWCPSDPGGESGETACAVETGDRIRLTLDDGEQIDGKLVDWDDRGITILTGPYGLESDSARYERERIAGVEEVGTGGVGTAVVIGVAAVLLVGGIAFYQSTAGLR